MRRDIEYIVEPNGCYRCTSHVAKGGKYTNVVRDGHTYHLSRFVWIQKHGQIPSNVHVLHDCDNHWCINVHHLHLGSHQDNMREAKERERFKGQLGENNPKSKIQVSDAITIFVDEMRPNALPKKYLMRLFDLSESHISAIKNAYCWDFEKII